MKIYDYLDRELNIGDIVIVAVPYQTGSIYKGRIMLITSKTIVINLMGRYHKDGKLVFEENGFNRKVPLNRAEYEIFKLNEDGYA